MGETSVREDCPFSLLGFRTWRVEDVRCGRVMVLARGELVIRRYHETRSHVTI